MSGWGCPHEVDGTCHRVKGKPCDPGMKGCVLYGRFVFTSSEKNLPGGPRRRSHDALKDRAPGMPGKKRS